MPNRAFERATNRALSRYGRPVTVIQPTTPVEGSQGDIEFTDSDEATTNADLVEPGSPRYEHLVTGIDVDVDAVIWLPETVTADVSVQTGEGDHDQAATIIDDPASGRYRAAHVVFEQMGKIRCYGQRIGASQTSV